MRFFSKKSLTLLLVLMLVLSPLQSAMAGVAAMPRQGETASQVECMHEGDMDMAADQKQTDCEHCDSGHACSSGHCTPLSALAVLPAFSYPTISTLTTSASLADVSFASQLHNSLFRPPRA